jgi:acetoacetate decarboxylase
MKLAEVRANAFAMPLTNPAYPRGPYKFYDREFVVITYRTDPDALRAVVPEPLETPSITSSSACPTPPDSAITRKQARSFRCDSAGPMA